MNAAELINTRHKLRSARVDLKRAGLPAEGLSQDQFDEVAAMMVQCGAWAGDRGKNGRTYPEQAAHQGLVEVSNERMDGQRAEKGRKLPQWISDQDTSSFTRE